MKLIIELPENDYKALKEEGVQNHIALADTIIAHGVPYEERSNELDEMTQDLIDKVNVNVGLAQPIKDERPQITVFCENADEKAIADMKEELQKVIDDIRPKGELAEKLKARIEESICKRCQMNENCVLCKISHVFQIITLTMEEQKGGAKNG